MFKSVLEWFCTHHILQITLSGPRMDIQGMAGFSNKQPVQAGVLNICIKCVG